MWVVCGLVTIGLVTAAMAQQKNYLSPKLCLRCIRPKYTTIKQEYNRNTSQIYKIHHIYTIQKQWKDLHEYYEAELFIASNLFEPHLTVGRGKGDDRW